MSKRNQKQIAVETTIIDEDTTTVIHTLIYEFSERIGAGNGGVDFEMQITDPQNPLLLFDYVLTASEFPALREQQQLFCEFSAFPESITSLFTSCNEHEEYHAVIDQHCENGPALLLQQMTKISLLTHLRLLLVPASDARLKEYLSHETTHFKTAYENAVQEIEELKIQLEKREEMSKEQYGQLEEEMTRQQSAHQEQMERLNSKFEEMINDLKATNSETMDKQNSSFEQKQQALMDKYDSQLVEVRKELSAVTSQRGQLAVQTERQAERISSLETQLSEAKSRGERMDEENVELRKLQKQVSDQNSSLQAELASITAKYDSLKGVFDQKVKFAESQGNSMDSLRSQLDQKEQQLAAMQGQLTEYAKKADERDWLAEKSKKVISKLQGDLKKTVQHHNEQKAIWEQKMNEMKQVEMENVRLEEKVKALELTISHNEEKIQDFQNRNEVLKNEITKLQEADAEKSQLVSYLENQLNKKGMEMLEDEAIDEEPAFVPGTPTKGGSLTDYAPSFNVPQTTTLFDQPVPFY